MATARYPSRAANTILRAPATSTFADARAGWFGAAVSTYCDDNAFVENRANSALSMEVVDGFGAGSLDIISSTSGHAASAFTAPSRSHRVCRCISQRLT